MKKKIALVSGGAGFIGSHLVDLLLKNKSDITTLSSPPLTVSRMESLREIPKLLIWA